MVEMAPYPGAHIEWPSRAPRPLSPLFTFECNISSSTVDKAPGLLSSLENVLTSTTPSGPDEGLPSGFTI
jgi:hypothetical protein